MKYTRFDCNYKAHSLLIEPRGGAKNFHPQTTTSFDNLRHETK